MIAMQLIAGNRVSALAAGPQDGFREAAQTAKENCPVSKALAAVPEITLEAELAG